jgi:hypothetical protein
MFPVVALLPRIHTHWGLLTYQRSEIDRLRILLHLRSSLGEKTLGEGRNRLPLNRALMSIGATFRPTGPLEGDTELTGNQLERNVLRLSRIDAGTALSPMRLILGIVLV